MMVQNGYYPYQQYMDNEFQQPQQSYTSAANYNNHNWEQQHQQHGAWQQIKEADSFAGFDLENAAAAAQAVQSDELHVTRAHWQAADVEGGGRQVQQQQQQQQQEGLGQQPAKTDMTVPVLPAMKVKELEVTANVAWSPCAQSPIYLASGTAAQQLDATFSTNSALEVHKLDLGDSDTHMPKVTSFPVEHRYHKLIWGAAGMAEGGRPNGIIVGGLDQGILTLYDAHKLLKGQHAGSLLATKDKHTGPVQALDFNPFQANLLASGASESEIYIWDVNKLTTPMTPGAKSQPADDVRCVAWNKQVQHILATTFATRCVVWDLRKNDPIIKLSDATSRMRAKVVAWHPDVATQLCLASEDDHTPVIQIWDLRLASSPIRTLESHTRGVLSVAWCQQDSDLLLSCGKDNRILCWNPNSNTPGGEVLCELASSNQWSFDVSWCPRNPAVVASSSFEGRVTVYSLMGGKDQAVPSTAIADSFPGMETMQPVQHSQQQQLPAAAAQLKTPPKWLMRPGGASFGFGGRLVTFDTQRPVPGQQQQQMPAKPQSGVYLSRVVTEEELVERSRKLETSIQNQNLPEFCESKIATAEKAGDRQVWTFIKASFGNNPRMEFLNLLGYNPEETARAIESVSGIRAPSPAAEDASAVDLLGMDLKQLDTTDDKESAFEFIAAKQQDAVEEDKRKGTFKIATDDGEVGLLTRALLTGNVELAVEICLQQDRTTDALILAANNPELLEKTQKRYFSKCESDESQLIECVVRGNWGEFAQRCSVENWKEALAAAVTYAPNEDFSAICAGIGDRLTGEAAMLCYICAGDLERLVEAWVKYREDGTSGPKALQDLVEVVMSLKSAVEQTFGEVNISSGQLSSRLSQYASLLASQGALSAALSYLGNSQEESIARLRERLEGAIGRRQQQQQHHQALAAQNSGSRLSALRKGSRTYSQSSEENFFQMSSGSRRRSSGNQYQHQQQQQQPLSSYQQPVSSYQQPPQQQPLSSYQQQPMQPQSMFDPRRSSITPAAAEQTYMTPSVDPSYHHVPDQGGPGHHPPVSSGPGWNDPPPMALSKPRNNSQTKTVSSIPEPITQPLFGVPSNVPAAAPPQMGMGMMPPPPQQQQQQYMNPGMGGGDPYGGYGAAPSFHQQQQMAPPPPSMWDSTSNNDLSAYPPSDLQQQQPANFMTPAAPVQQQQQPANFPSPPSGMMRQRQEPPKEKGPLPQEHAVLQEVFETLRTKCLAAANHPQIRRKLDDVAKKLEILYDKLRENALSADVTSGLHRIVACIRAHDHQSGLIVIHELVSTGSFATLSEFLPGVKVLLQVASQLGVYVTC